MANHSHEYIGRHRLPEHHPDDHPTDNFWRKSLELFTHGPVPMSALTEKEK